MRIGRLLWKVPVGLVGTALGAVLLVLVAVGCALYVTPVRKAVIEKALPIVQEKTGLDIDLKDIYLSPFHHSPMVFYRAYKGEGDLPLEVRIDSLFVGHRNQDSLVYVRALRLRAKALTSTCENGIAEVRKASAALTPPAGYLQNQSAKAGLASEIR